MDRAEQYLYPENACPPGKMWPASDVPGSYYNTFGGKRDKSVCDQVQAQARERRRSDRKEKRELGKEKALAEYKARDLEGMMCERRIAPYLRLFMAKFSRGKG